MRLSWSALPIALEIMGLASVPAFACFTSAPLDLNDIEYADVVVVGRIIKYEIVPDEQARRRRKRMLEESHGLPPKFREKLESQTRFMSDYARFKIEVDEVVRGEAGKTILATWDNSTFREPESLSSGQLLIALREPSSKLPPIRSGSATFRSAPEAGLLTVLQAPCSTAFIFDRGSETAKAALRVLGHAEK